jgi:hypothetical protein
MHFPRRSLTAVALLALSACNLSGTLTDDANPSEPLSGPTDRKAQPLGGTVHTDTFVQGDLIGGYADILFVVDNSGSMFEEQARLATSFNTFITWITNEKVDFHIAITTTDMDDPGQSGAFVGTPKVLTNNTPNLVSTFMTNVRVGVNGSALEQPFDAANAALTNPLISTTNAGFLRPNAKLFVVFVSDEDDQSILTPAALVQSLRGLKTDPGQVHFTAIVGAAGNTCAAKNAINLLDAIHQTSGLTGSICDSDFGVTLKKLAFEVTKASGEYFLTQIPDPTTITVKVAGSLLDASHWTYNPATNSVKLDEASIPVPGTIITITYELPGTRNNCLRNGEVVYDLNGGEDSWKFYCIEVPPGTTDLLVHSWDGRGDMDIYLKKGGNPGAGNWDFRSIIEDQDETLLLGNPSPGTYFIGLYGFHRFEDVNIQPMWISSPSTPTPLDAGTWTPPDAGTTLDAGTPPPTDGGTLPPTDAGTPLPTAHALISGVFYDTPGDDAVEEFVEIHNPSAQALNLTGWTITDNGGAWLFPTGTMLQPGGFLSVARNSAGFQALFAKAPSISGLTLSLGNAGDFLMLKAPGDVLVDTVAWKGVVPGWSISVPSGSELWRVVPGLDTDTALDWTAKTPAQPRSP